MKSRPTPRGKVHGVKTAGRRALRHPSIAKAMKYSENTHSLNKTTSVMGKEERARSKTEKKSAGNHFQKYIFIPPNQSIKLNVV